MSDSPMVPDPSLTAADISRAPTMSRPETPQTSRLLTAALVAILMAATTQRRPGVRRQLELSISSKSDWWRPIPGGRAPPAASTPS